VTAPLELPYATSSDGKISSLVVIFFIDFVSAGNKTRESKSAFPAVPNMTGALIAPVLRPFGGDQLITALNAFHPEAGTTIGNSHPHGSLHSFAFT
jgi:hypothetical protein